MFILKIIVSLFLLLPHAKGASMENTFYSFHSQLSTGESFDFAQLKGKVVLIVNVASRCGFTKQYDGLQKIYESFRDQNFVILGFPCNQFGSQEPGTNKEIQEFCRLEYGVTFPIMNKIDVNGENADPIYKWLKSQAKGLMGTEAIKWNFTKFLIDKNGNVIDRFAPQTEPAALETHIKALLQ